MLTLKLRSKDISMILPHEWFGCIHAASEPVFQEVFGEARACGEYWDAAQREPWFADHPHRSSMDSHTVPLRVFGDDVSTKSSFSMLVVSICSAVTSAGKTHLVKLLVLGLPLRHLAEDWAFLKWDSWARGVIQWGLWARGVIRWELRRPELSEL
eukprot:6960957-Alexandrium_andersonii.AAC.1